MGSDGRCRDHEDPCTAHGFRTRSRYAEWLAHAIRAGFLNSPPLEDALVEYDSKRDEHLTAVYELTYGLRFDDHENVGWELPCRIDQ
jgi:hypothetical protein